MTGRLSDKNASNLAYLEAESHSMACQLVELQVLMHLGILVALCSLWLVLFLCVASSPEA
jgi:hypothetical protein